MNVSTFGGGGAILNHPKRGLETILGDVSSGGFQSFVPNSFFFDLNAVVSRGSGQKRNCFLQGGPLRLL